VRILEGLLGDSDREGYKRLYCTPELDYYAKFRIEDVVFRELIPTEQAPLVGYETTRVDIKHDAEVEYTLTASPRAQAKSLQGGLAATHVTIIRPE